MFRHLCENIRRGALVLLLVCLFSVLALAGTKNAPMATSVSAYTSGSSTLITIYSTAPMAYSVSRPDAHTIMVNLPGVDASRLSDSYSVNSPLVSGVVIEHELHSPDNITSRMRVSLLAPARDRSELARNNLVLELMPANAGEVSPTLANAIQATDALVAQPQPQQQEKPQTRPTPTPRPNANVNITAAQDGRQQSQGEMYGQPGFVGEPINLNVVNADIRDILNYITEQYGVNFVIDSSVGPVPVTVNVTDVPWNVALNAILKANRLGIDANGNILRIATVEVLANEAASQQKINDARLDNSPLVTEFIRLNYARGADTLTDAAGPTSGFTGGATNSPTTSFSGNNLQGNPVSGSNPTGSSAGDQGIIPIIRRRLSRRGSVEGDGRSNTLIITDVKENIDAIRQLVSLLDQPEPQVEIETRIVVASRNFSRDLGVQLAALSLGANGRAGSFATLPGSSATGGTGGTGGQNTTGIVPNGIPNGIGQQPTNSLGANLASTVIGLTTGRIGTAQISALITAAESKGQAKIVATPRVTALNNRPAEISSGQQIPVVTPQTGAGGTSGVLVFTTTFVSVPLRLQVTPQITDAGTVVLRVIAENNTINTAIAINGTPGIDTQKMQTEVLVPDGGTTVVGGVLADNESEIQNRTPGLASVPILGNLFKRKAISRQTNEILFFITPRIYRPDYQGRPTTNPISTGTRSTTISQPVPLGNPPTNTPTSYEQQQQQQQAAPQTPNQSAPLTPNQTAPGSRP